MVLFFEDADLLGAVLNFLSDLVVSVPQFSPLIQFCVKGDPEFGLLLGTSDLEVLFLEPSQVFCCAT